MNTAALDTTEALAQADRLEGLAANANTEAQRADYLRRAEAMRTRVDRAREERERFGLLEDCLYQISLGRPSPWTDAQLSAMSVNELRGAHSVICVPKPGPGDSGENFSWVRSVDQVLMAEP